MARKSDNTEMTDTVIEEQPRVNVLVKKRVELRLLPRMSGLFKEKNHVLSNNFAPTSRKRFTVPRMANGQLARVLDENEQEQIEKAMGLDDGELSIYKVKDNYWEKPETMVSLGKDSNFLDLSNPVDYIKYKILLANRDLICPSIEEFKRMPKASYIYVIMDRNDEVNEAKDKMSDIQICYKEFGKIDEDCDTMRAIIETIQRRKVSATAKAASMQVIINDLIQQNPKLFKSVIMDPMLSTKVTINKALEIGVVVRRGEYLYVKDGDIPMCGSGEEPTMPVACKWLNLPKNQQIKFGIEDKVNNR